METHLHKNGQPISTSKSSNDVTHNSDIMDSSDEIGVHDLIIDEDYESDTEEAGSPDDINLVANVGEHVSHVDNVMLARAVSLENCRLHDVSAQQESTPNARPNETFAATTGGVTDNLKNLSHNASSRRENVTYISGNFIPILPLPVVNKLPVLNYTPFVFSGLNSVVRLQNTTLGTHNNNAIASRNIVSDPQCTTSTSMKHNSLSCHTDLAGHPNKDDTCNREKNIPSTSDKLIKAQETKTSKHLKRESCQPNDCITFGTNIPTTVNSESTSVEKGMDSTVHQMECELRQDTDPFRKNTTESGVIQDVTTQTQESLLEIDTLTDTINRVAAGEGFIRQRFTPKAKRKKISVLQRKAKQGDSTLNCGKETSTGVKSHRKIPLSISENMCGSSTNTASSDSVDVLNSSIDERGKPATNDGSKIADHYLLHRPDDRELSKLNIGIDTSANVNVHHYLLQTPPRTSKHIVSKQSSTEKVNNENPSERTSNSSDDRKQMPNKSCVQTIPVENISPVKKSNKPAFVTYLSSDSSKNVGNLSMAPKVTLNRLKGVSPNTTVVLCKPFYEKQLDYGADENDKNENMECTVTPYTTQGNLDLPHEQVDPVISPVQENETSGKLDMQSSTNSHSITATCEQDPLIYAWEQTKIRSTIRDKNSNVYVIPKPGKRECHQTFVKTGSDVKQRFDMGPSSNNPRRPKQDMVTQAIPVSPKAITKDVYQYLVSNNHVGNSLNISKTTVCNRSIPQKQTSTVSVHQDLRPQVTNHSSNLLNPNNNVFPPRTVSDYSSKVTVAGLLKMKKLDPNCSKEFHVSNPLTVYGQIVNGDKNESLSQQHDNSEIFALRYIGPKLSLGSATPQTQPFSKPVNVASSLSIAATNDAVCSSFQNNTVPRSVSSSSKSMDQKNRESLHEPETQQSTSAPNCQTNLTMPSANTKVVNISTETSNPFSIKIGNKMYVVKPKVVTQTPDIKEHKLSPRTTLPAPKLKINRCGKRPVDLSPNTENSNQTIKKKIKRMVSNKRDPFETLTRSLELMPKHKQERRIKEMLKKRSKLIFSPTTLYPNDNSKVETYDKTAGNSDCGINKRMDKNIHIHVAEKRTNNITTPDTVKMALTMTISKSSEGKYEYSIQRTKINYMSRQCTDFRRWFKYSNYPCTLSFKEGKYLENIDVATIKQGLYHVVCSEKPLGEVDRCSSSKVSAVLALYPPQLDTLPCNSDALVIGHIENVADNRVYPDTSTIDNIENLLGLVLGPKASKASYGFSDERYKSVVDETMTPRNHSPLFYSRDMHEYFTDGEAARESDRVTDTGVDKKISSHNRSSSVDYRELDKGRKFVNYTEKAMALKIKQTKLLESCQKLQNERKRAK